MLPLTVYRREFHKELLPQSGGEGIRTPATSSKRPNAFQVRPLITTWVLLHIFFTYLDIS